MIRENLKRSGQIPAFGNWDFANDFPITQYFETAREAGILRHSSFSGDLNLYDATSSEDHKDNDIILYPRTTAIKVKEQRKKQRKVFDEAAAPLSVRRRKNGKAVDEDLYKIPADDLLYAKSKQRKTHWFFSRCLLPSCSI